MNWFHNYRKLLHLCVILLFLSINDLLNAQNCDFLESDSIQVNSTIYNMDAEYTQQYALTSAAGQILDIQSSPSFAAQSTGNYSIYALNYETNAGVTGFSIGNNIGNISSTCFDTTQLVINVCINSSNCHSRDGTINLSITGANTNADFTQSYALTNISGTILDINTNPPSLSPLFSGKATGVYKVYALNYETVSGINNYSIGSDIDLVTGTCLDITNALYYQICADTPICHSEDGTVNINNSGFNEESGYTQSYALVNTNGIIQRIKDNPTTTQPLFWAVSSGEYEVYALNYETVSGINNYLVGNAINTVSGTCLDIASPIDYNVCSCTYTGCNSTDGYISVAITNQNQAAEFTQAYALTDTFGLIIQISTNPTSTDSLFETIPTGYYHIYSLNYETANGINGLTVGDNIAAISGSCFDITGALCYQVCNDNYDFGDLPDTSDSTEMGDYQTLLANNGPRHLIISGLYLGDTIDIEVDGLPDTLAEGDGVDEDGLKIFSSLNISPGMKFRVPFNYVNTTGDTAHIEGWIDWNGDGDFDDLDEIVIDLDDADGNINNVIEIMVSNNALNGAMLGIRIRISLQDNMTPYGSQPNGEVEDYLLNLSCPSKICLPIGVVTKKEIKATN